MTVEDIKDNAAILICVCWEDRNRLVQSVAKNCTVCRISVAVSTRNWELVVKYNLMPLCYACAFDLAMLRGEGFELHGWLRGNEEILSAVRDNIRQDLAEAEKRKVQ